MGKVLWLEDISQKEKDKVGEKAAYLGELNNKLETPVLPGFSTTSNFYRDFLTKNELKNKIEQYLNGIDSEDLTDLQRRSKKVKGHIKESDVPENLRKKLLNSYKELGEELNDKNPEVAIRTSLTGEKAEVLEDQQNDLRQASGREELLKAVKEVYAEFFNERSVSYREENDIGHFDIDIGLIIQQTGGEAASGEAFSFDPETLFEGVVTVNAIHGTGGQELRSVKADEFTVFKQNYGIIEKNLGSKKVRLSRDSSGELVKKKVPINDRERFALTDNQVKELSKYTKRVQDHFDDHVELEWVLNGLNKRLNIVEVRTKPKITENEVIENHILEEKSEILIEGEAVGSKIGSGELNIVNSPRDLDSFEEGDVLVTDATSPEWEPLMEKASAVITNQGGRSSHTASFARELGIPAIIGTENATSRLSDGDKVTVDCSSGGKVWKEELEHTWEEHDISELPSPETSTKLNIDSPYQALRAGKLPIESANTSIGSIILSEFEEHPLKIIETDEDEYVERLRSALGRIGAAFYPGDVVIRLNDLTSSEFQQFEGFEQFEEDEDNPELGLRGASRLCHSRFSKLFEKDCEAIRKAIDELELNNISVSVPFCRNIEEAKNLRAKMKEYGLDQGDIDVYLAVETPGNVVRAEEFSEIFDGFSVDLESITSLTLGIDEDSRELSPYLDERDPAVKETVKHIIRRAEVNQTGIGIIGDSVTEHQRYLKFLLGEDVDWISVDPNKALRTIWEIDEIESSEEEDVGYEFDIEGMVGTPAGHVHEALEAHGTATAQKLISLTPDKLDSETVHQALGWLANEGRIMIENQEGKIMYSLR